MAAVGADAPVSAVTDRAELVVRVTFMGDLISLVGARELQLNLPAGATVGDLLGRLADSYGEGFSSRVFSGPQRLHHTMLIFVDGEDIKQHGDLAAELHDSAVEVIMLPMIGGGEPWR